MDCGYRDWAGLPGELLHIVLNKLDSHRDYISFYQVCKSWLLVVREHEEEEVLSLRHLLLFTVPYLDDQIHIWLLRNHINHQKQRLWLTSSDFKHVCGCSHGWFAFIDPYNHLVLRNPLSSRTNPLPPLQFESGSKVSKVVLSQNPDLAPLDCLVVAIYGEHNQLAITKLGSGSWTYLDPSLKLFTDVMFDGDRLFAVDKFARLVSFVPQFGRPYVSAAKVEVVVPCCKETTPDVYIVRSCRSSAVLMVRWRGYGSGIQVFKLVAVDRKFQWEEVKSLEDELLLVGLHHSVSLSCIGIFSTLPNQVYIGRSGAGVFQHALVERPRKRALWNNIHDSWKLSPPPKLQKLFCLNF